MSGFVKTVYGTATIEHHSTASFVEIRVGDKKMCLDYAEFEDLILAVRNGESVESFPFPPKPTEEELAERMKRKM